MMILHVVQSTVRCFQHEASFSVTQILINIYFLDLTQNYVCVYLI